MRKQLVDPNDPLEPLGAIAVAAQPSAIAAAPYDFNPGIDLAVTHPDNDTLTLLFNNGAARVAFSPQILTLPSGTRPRYLAVDPFDPDNDKDYDIPVGQGQPQQQGQAIVIVNNAANNPGGSPFDPTPQFVSFPLGVGLTQLVVAPLGDPSTPAGGAQAIVSVNRDDATCSVLVNTSATPGTPEFAPTVNLPLPDVSGDPNLAGIDPTSLTLLDLDEDGDRELAVVARVGPTQRVVRVLRNDFDALSGQVAFAPAGDYPTAANPVLVTAADLNGDSRKDLVTLSAEIVAGRALNTVSIRLNRPWLLGDLDGDGGVDVDDFYIFAACMRGPDVPIDAACLAADLVPDSVVRDADLEDFAVLQSAAGSPQP